MELVKTEPDQPSWVHRGDGVRVERATVEYKRLRIVIYRRPGYVGWFASAHPVIRSVSLKAQLLEEAKEETMVRLRQELSALVFKLEVLDRCDKR